MNALSVWCATVLNAEHDLDGAKKTAKDMLNVLKNWKPEDLKYKE